MYHSIADINWPEWQPQQRATLLFVIHEGKMLLIHKKRGLGAGKINGPGGRLEPGETELEAAVRETREELCIEPLNVAHCGELSFQFLDGLALHVTVFRASDYSGKPEETGEAKPIWVSIDDIPYDKMWQDDAYWVPLMLAGNKFKGFFLFDDSQMVDFRLETLSHRYGSL